MIGPTSDGKTRRRVIRKFTTIMDVILKEYSTIEQIRKKTGYSYMTVWYYLQDIEAIYPDKLKKSKVKVHKKGRTAYMYGLG